MRNFICAVFICVSTAVAAQSQQIQLQLDSLDKKLSADSANIYRFRKVRPFLNFHNRNSINEIIPVNFYGFQFGAVFFERHIVGYGRYFSNKKTKRPYSYSVNETEFHRSVNIDYHTAFYQFIFLTHRWFELHVPIELGYGKISSKFYTPAGYPERTSAENMFMTSYGLQVILKPVRWSGITGNFGYRGSSEGLVDGFYYAVGLWIGLKPVMEDFNYYILKRSRYRRAKAALLKN